MTVHNKFLTCTQQYLWHLYLIYLWYFRNFLDSICLIRIIKISYMVNIEFRNFIVTLRLIIAIILEVIMILLCFWYELSRGQAQDIPFSYAPSDLIELQSFGSIILTNISSIIIFKQCLPFSRHWIVLWVIYF